MRNEKYDIQCSMNIYNGDGDLAWQRIVTDINPLIFHSLQITVLLYSQMPSIVLNEPGVKIVQDSTSLTIGDSVKIVVSGMSPTCVKVSKTVPPTDNTHLETKTKQQRSRISRCPSPMDVGGKP